MKMLVMLVMVVMVLVMVGDSATPEHISIKSQLTTGFFLFLALVFSGWRASYQEFKESRPILLRTPENIHRLSFGYKGLLADSIWIRAIQDMDLCQVEGNQRYCRNQSWLFSLLNGVSNLTPKFRMVYAVGALNLAVISSDKDGARQLFDKGVLNFPIDWPILYRAAYFYLYEDFNPDKAADLLRQAGTAGAPPWVFNLAKKLDDPKERVKVAELLLNDLQKSQAAPEVINKIKKQIESLR